MAGPGATSIICLGTTPALQRTMVFGRLAVGGVNRAREVAEYASGKPVNVGRVLRALGREALFIGPVGGDGGHRLRRDLDAAGIAADLVEVAAQTRLCITAVDLERREATELVEEAGALAPAEADEVLERLRQRLEGAPEQKQARLATGVAGVEGVEGVVVVVVVVMSGSLAAGAGDDFYARAVRLARAAGVRTMIDARDRPLLAALEQRPDVVKLNAEELGSTLGRDMATQGQLREGMRALLGLGAGAVVVTRGRAGAMATDGRRVVAVESPRVDAISPIGSGDAFAAGLAAALVDGADLADGCRLGAACGAANAESARAGHVEAGRVTELQGQVRVQVLD